jgi:hypothetical protein
MSELKTNLISPYAGNTVTLGESGDTIALAAGATATGFGGDANITRSASDPAADTNPAGGVGTIWANTTSGEMFVCTNSTAGANVWVNTGEGSGNVPNLYMSATGGTITTDGSYKVHTFTESGTFTPTLGDVVAGTVVDVLVVAGGASGGSDLGGGGGAGGLIYSTSFTVSESAITVTVGAGGALATGTVRESNTQGNNGADSVFSSLTAIGGGHGGSYWAGNATYHNGGAGGSGGGSGPGTSGSGSGGAGTASQGNAGGAGGYATTYHSGGGGGAGAIGGSVVGNGTTSGSGGVGSSNDITGTSTFYAGGGGGGAYTSGNAGAGGNGGGGQGFDTGAVAVAGTVNTGGGGGGGGYTGTVYHGGAGGSGIVIIRYQFQA